MSSHTQYYCVDKARCLNAKRWENTLRHNTKIAINIAGMAIEHPVMNASGVLGGFEPEHIDLMAKRGVSAFVTKTMTLEPRKGFEPPIIVILENQGALNAVGLSNPGVKSIDRLVKRAKLYGKPIIVSIGGSNIDEFVKAALIAEDAGADAVELNLSCPHTKGFGLEMGADPSLVYQVVKDTSSVLKKPVIVKLGLSDRVVESAGKALEGGAMALTLINTLKAMAIDIYTLRPILSNIYGGLSGPPIHPIAVRVVYDVFKEHEAEIIGCGGIYSWKSAIELILAGAKALQVGTALVMNEGVIQEIIDGITKWLEIMGIDKLEDAVGLAVRR
ncbi:MAG: dihydroorotate dehydrogenase PyrD [Desulfurococcaceae archaeon]